MVQPERLEEFERFRATQQVYGVSTYAGYDPIPAITIPTSGTAAFPEEAAFTNPKWPRQSLPHRARVQATIWTIAGVDAGADLSAFDATLDFNIRADNVGELAESQTRGVVAPELRVAIQRAENEGLDEIAVRLRELAELPPEEGVFPLSAESAGHFVTYCVTRQKRGRPIMTATPTGELDCTWKAPQEGRVVMRFFPDGLVWVAFKFKRPKQKGSFEISAEELPKPDQRFRIPDWA